MHALAASNISVKAGARFLLQDVSLAVAPGERLVLVGPNGAGKSTLLRVLAGALRPYAGTVQLAGQDIRTYTPRALAARRSVLSQSVSVAFPFSVEDVVRMGAGDDAGPSLAATIDAALHDVDLVDFRDRIITTLSGGEQQRAHFARILVQLACGERAHGPGVLLLDEPTASLDLRHQMELLSIARRHADRGVTVIAVVHDLNLAASFASRIVVLDRGRIAAEGAAADTITDDVLRRVFGVSSAVGRMPAAGVPFVLPHAISVERRAP